MSFMNTQTFLLLAGFTLGSLVGVGTSAQAQTTNTPTAPSPAPEKTPRIANRTDMVALRFGLTDEQKQKVKPIFEDEARNMLEMRRGATMKPEERRVKLSALREETDAKLKQVLTPEQMGKYLSARTNTPKQSPGYIEIWKPL